MAADWQLGSCCGTEEIVFIVLLAVYFVINLVLWNTFIIKPMKVRVAKSILGTKSVTTGSLTFVFVLSIVDCRLCP